MNRTAWILGSVSALLGVAAGAFGAHALKASVPPDLLAVYETGVRYQIFHALALLAIGLGASLRPGERWSIPIWLFASGTVLFSGSLYLLAWTGVRWLGAVTPVGGLCFLAGWLATAVIGGRRRSAP
ncbi:MAG: DUF423 domain-containing protein [Gemmatimonadota bacterium]|jgi:uncharacterized membrane protein YgdD (TMEM256/DUF423 family)